MTPREIDRFCKPDAGGLMLLRDAMHNLHWSARAYHCVLRVACAVPDLAGQQQVSAPSIFRKRSSCAAPCGDSKFQL